MKRTALIFSLLTAILLSAPTNATVIEAGSHTLSFGITEAVYLLGTADLLLVDGGSALGWINVRENATLTMLGGHIEGNLYALGAERITIKGGTISGEIKLDSSTQGDVYIYGTDFAIDGVPVGPGNYNQTGVFTGTLENGDLLDNRISFSGSNKVVLVPEPATLILLTMGTLYIRKRKSAC